MSIIQESAVKYSQSGLSVIPTLIAEKSALIKWSDYQLKPALADQVNKWFTDFLIKHPNNLAIAIVSGEASGHLECIDFDHLGEKYADWCTLVNKVDPTILTKVVIQRTQHAGYHVVYRCPTGVGANDKLAERKVANNKIETLIETRGNGGYFLAYPTTGYVMEQGSFDNVPIITGEQRQTLIECAMTLTEIFPEVKPIPQSVIQINGLRPGDDYNQKVNIQDLHNMLEHHKWTYFGSNKKAELFTRPDKPTGVSGALFSSGVFVNFSSNAGLEQYDKSKKNAYSPFALLTALEFEGNFSAAGKWLFNQGYGKANFTPPPSAPINYKHVEPPSKEELPPLKRAYDLTAVRTPIMRPDLWSNIIRRRDIVFIGGASKMRKTWTLIQMATCASVGKPIFGEEIKKSKVLYVNLELQEDSFNNRIEYQRKAMGISEEDYRETFFEWNLRGYQTNLKDLSDAMIKQAKGFDFIFVDPIYKLFDGNENETDVILRACNEFDRIALLTGAAIISVFHYAKGDSSKKDPIDRISGSGITGRYPDTLLLFTPHEVEDAFTVDFVFRDHERRMPVVVKWEFPMLVVTDLSPQNLKTTKPAAKSACSMIDLINVLKGKENLRANIITDITKRTGCSKVAANDLFNEAWVNGKLKIRATTRAGTNALKQYSLSDNNENEVDLPKPEIIKPKIAELEL